MGGGRIGVGVVGCGWISEAVHLPNLRAHPRFEVVALCDRAEARRAVASRLVPDASAVADVGELLADPRVQAVLVALPPAVAGPIVASALAAGKDVYVEKPCAVTAEAAQAMVAAWRASGRTLMVGYNFRLNPIFRHAAETVREGRVGRLATVQSRFTWRAEAKEGWRADAAAGGGVLLDLASHHIDLFAALTGRPAAYVTARERALVQPGDTIDLMLEDQGGAVLQLHASLAAGAPSNRMSLLGTGGQLEADLLERRPARPLTGAGRFARAERVGRALAGLHPARLLGAPGYEPSFALALDAFAAACAGAAPAEPDPTAALAVLHVIEAARASIAADGARTRVSGH